MVTSGIYGQAEVTSLEWTRLLKTELRFLYSACNTQDRKYIAPTFTRTCPLSLNCYDVTKNLGRKVAQVFYHCLGRCLFSGKGPSATGFSPISRYMEDFGEEKMCQTVKSSLSLMDPHLFSEAGSITYEKCPLEKIDRAITTEGRRP